MCLHLCFTAVLTLNTLDLYFTSSRSFLILLLPMGNRAKGNFKQDGTIKNHSLNSLVLREKARTVRSAVWRYIILYNATPHKLRSAVRQKASSSDKDCATERYCLP